MAMVILTDTQMALMSLKPKSGGGNPATIDGVPAWNSSNTEVLTLEPAADGLTCKAVTTGKLTDPDTSVQVQCVADADLGNGTREITAVQDFQVKAGEAVQLGIEVGAPQEKPAP